MYYDIDGLCPRTDISMGGHGFCIKLYPEWRGLVAGRALTQENVTTAIGRLGRAWLDACGYDGVFDPDNSGFRKDSEKPPGPEARPMYEPGRNLRVSWGEWGPEHISVPGDACGLDLDDSFGAPLGGRTLSPHNVDSANQKLLLLIVFTWFANDLACHRELQEFEATAAQRQGDAG